MKKILTLWYLINIPKYWNPLIKKESIVIIVETFLNISCKDIYREAKGIRLDLGLPKIKRFGLIILEKEPAIINSAIYKFEEFLANLRADFIFFTKKIYKDKQDLYELITLKSKKDLLRIPKTKEYLKEVEFEETNQEIKLDTDNVVINYKITVPNRKTPKEIELSNKLGESFHKSALEDSSVRNGQFKRNKIPVLPKAKKIEPIREPKHKNILAYASTFTVWFIRVSLLGSFLSEGIVIYTIARYNIGLNPIKSGILATIILGITFVISRFFYHKIKLLVLTTKKQWKVILYFSIALMIHLTLSGVIVNYNIQQSKKIQTLKEDRKSLALKQGRLFDLEENTDDYIELNKEVEILEKDVKNRAESLKNKSIFLSVLEYFIVALLSLLSIFFAINLKVLEELYSTVYNLKKAIQKNEILVTNIEQGYVKKAEKLLTSYDNRHLLFYYLSKKNAIEKLLSMEKDLKTEDFYKAYNIK